ncbi:MAG: hypothetical protein K8S15_06165 [Candidatus Aegiribacteria sp.]|nr:hypothetical protein [Candidatus Aegiribacteria sp.]
MLKMCYVVRGVLPVILLSVMSCSWSAKQQEILDAYNESAGYINRNEWESAASSMSSSTILFLDSLADDLSTRGLQGYESGTDLLPVLYTECIDFNGDVTMIFIQGDRAEITLTSGKSYKFPMIFEGNCWKLDLSEIFRNNLDTALTGSYVR